MSNAEQHPRAHAIVRRYADDQVAAGIVRGLAEAGLLAPPAQREWAAIATFEPDGIRWTEVRAPEGALRLPDGQHGELRYLTNAGELIVDAIRRITVLEARTDPEAHDGQ